MAKYNAANTSLAFGETLDVAFSVWRRAFWFFVAVDAVVMAPLGILTALNVVSAGSALHPSSAFIYRSSVLNMIQGLAWLLQFGALVHGSLSFFRGEDPVFKGSYRASVTNYGRLFVVAVIVAVASAVGMAIVLVPGLIILTYWSLGLIYVVDQRSGPIEALRSSFHLVRGRFWRVFGIYLITGAILFGLTLLAEIPIGMILAAASANYQVTVLVSGLVGTALQILLVSFPILAMVVVYRDLSGGFSDRLPQQQFGLG